MTLTKDQISDWLKRAGRDRYWLGDKCGVSKGTVDQWFYKGFSDAALATIRALMELDEQAGQGGGNDTGLIQFSTGEFERIERARVAVGSPTRPEFYRDAIVEYVKEIEAMEGRLTDGPARVEIAMAAEDEKAGPVEGENKRVRYPRG